MYGHNYFVITEPSFTGRAVNAVNWPKKIKSQQRFLRVKLLSSKDKAVISIEGKNVCLIIVFNAMNSIIVIRLSMQLVKRLHIACMLWLLTKLL